MAEHEIVSAPYNRLTIMLSLPRSRSAWMAEFLRPFCATPFASMHNPLQQCASIDELGQRIDALPPGRVFISDVAALFFFDKLLVRFPGAQYLLVHRPAHEVESSMHKLGIQPPLNIRNAERQLHDIALHIRTHPWAMTGTFFELNSPAILAAIAKFATGADVQPGYLFRTMQRNVQVPISEQIARTDLVKQRTLFGSAKIIH